MSAKPGKVELVSFHLGPRGFRKTDNGTFRIHLSQDSWLISHRLGSWYQLPFPRQGLVRIGVGGRKILTLNELKNLVMFCFMIIVHYLCIECRI